MLKISTESENFSKIGGKSETGGNASWPQGGWTPLLDKGLPVQLKNEIRDLGLILTRQGPDNDVACHGTCEDQLRNPKTAEVCFSVSHARCESPSSATFDAEPNRLVYCMHCRLCRCHEIDYPPEL